MSANVVMLLSNGLRSDPRVEKEAAALANSGRRVTVIAWDREGGLPEREEKYGFVIERLGPRAPYGGGLRNIRSFRDFWDRAARRAVALQPDVLHCHDLDTAPAGMRAKEVTGAALVMDFHEVYGESAMVPQSGLVGVVARRLVSVLEKRAIARSDLVVVAPPGSLAHFQQQGAQRVIIVENAPDHRFLTPCARQRDHGDPLVVGFFGQKRYVEPLAALVAVVARDPGLRVLLAGGGPASARVAELAAGSDRVEDRGRYSYGDLPDLYAECDVVYSVYPPDLGNVRMSLPNKVLEGMSCGLPVIVAAGTWLADFVMSEGVGLAVPACDEDALREALVRLKDDPGLATQMGRRGREVIEDRLNWQLASQRLLDAYEEL